MNRRKILPYLVLTLVLFLPLALLDTAKLSYAKGKGKAEDTQNSKAKKQKKEKFGKEKKVGEKKGEKWKPPGLSKKEDADWAKGIPPGWSRGRKVGWRGRNYPPGFDKWDKGKKEKWKKDKSEAMKQAEAWARESAESKNMDEEKIESETESVLTSLDNSAKAGVPIDKVLEVIRKSIDKNVHGRNIERICRAMVHTAAEGADPDAVAAFTGILLDEEVDGQEVAFKIYIRFGRR